MVNSENIEEFVVKKKEIKGYREFAKSGVTLDWDSSIRNLLAYAQSRIGERNVKRALDLLRLAGNERVLDFGAGRCWASYLFSGIGCYTVAFDFNTDDVVGLKAGNTLVRETNATFERVAGDCENMPFKKRFFDVVWGFQVFHHAYDLDRMVAEAARVLKKGGVLIAVGEHRRGIFQSEKALRKKHKAVEFGVNEHFPTYFAYKRAFQKAGLSQVRMFHTLGWEYLEDMLQTLIPCRYRTEFLVRAGKCILKSEIARKLILVLFSFNVTILAKKLN